MGTIIYFCSHQEGLIVLCFGSAEIIAIPGWKGLLGQHVLGSPRIFPALNKLCLRIRLPAPLPILCLRNKEILVEVT